MEINRKISENHNSVLNQKSEKINIDEIIKCDSKKL